MEEMKTNIALTDAKECLLDDSNLNPVEQDRILLDKPPASQTPFHKNDTLALLEELPRDKSAKALSGIQSALFIHAGATTASSENLVLTEGTVNGPVSHSALPASSVNKGSVSLTTGQSAGHCTDSCSVVMVEHVPIQLASDQMLFSLPDVANANYLAHSMNKSPTSDSLANCEMQKDTDDSLNTCGSPSPQIELCQDTKSMLVKDEGIESSTEVCQATDNSRPQLNSNQDPQKDYMQHIMNDETEKPQIQCTVRTEKRRKRKMDVSKITRYFPEDSYDLDNSPKKLKLLDDEGVEQCDEQQLDVLPDCSLNKVKSEPLFDESGESYPDETVDAFEDYVYSPVSRFIDDVSPVHSNDFLLNTFNETDQFFRTTSSGDQEPSFYPCTKCNVNFREKKHLHRHMMYHLDSNSHFRHLNIPRPYACKECGRTFRDRNSLLKHMVIHQERRQKLMEEIRELNELQDEGRGARLQCPQCVFGTNCPKTFVQHAKTHEKDKQYHCCDECNFMAITENELDCHRSIAHTSTMNGSMFTNEISQRKAQKKLSEKSAFLLPSKSPVFMCKLCPFTTTSRNVLKKHIEYLHPASCVDQFNSHVFLENRESDITGELLDFGSQTKQFINQSTFPKNTLLKHDLKRPFGSTSQSSSFTKNHRKQNIQKSGKYLAQEDVYFQHSSPNQNILIKNDQSHRYFNQMAKQKSDFKLNSAYLCKQEQQRYSMAEGPNRHYLNFKKEGRLADSAHLFPTQGNTQSSGVNLNSPNRNVKKSDRHASMQSVKKIKREDLDTEEDLDGYPDFLHNMTVVVLQKFDRSEKKNTYDTEDESSWDNGEICDYASKATEDDSYNNIASNANVHTLFKKVKDQTSDQKVYLNSQHTDDFYFEYYDDAEGRFMHELQDGEHTENAETALPNHNSIFDWADLSLEKKNCPYCPAIFETGVGLSNHVRGHLHRAGLTYEARHVVSPEQIATSDKMQHFKRIGTPIKRIRKVIEKSESASEHTCQLCGGWFDTKIGLSNHVRGHLKRLGKTKWDAHKSPICVLNEMMQDEEKCEKIIKALNCRRNIHRPYASRRFASREDLSAAGLPLEAHHNGLKTEATLMQPLEGHHLTHGFDEMHSDIYNENRNPSLTLIELLKNKQLGDGSSPENSPQKNHNQTARKRFNQKCILPINEDCTLVYQPHTAVDISVIECKQKKSRSGSKKKGVRLPHSADEVYILRCRFCGLVFKGPLSVQEDWIKHLQRHIVNANLPRTGAGMVEVASLLKPPSISETSFSLLMAETAS
ncbi:zinc finger protein 644 isoform X2 [Ambystoma mexicanum]|uniref:zinc finger protein 644 isoform X2 n=1 Tax=Ambystoma mexicanum TaxID=8296 RepID=UPI0037E941CC